MGVTTLLTNSQGRDFCPYLFIYINIRMKVHFIERLDKISVNVNKLLFDFETFKDKVTEVNNHGNAILVQKKFHLILNNKEADDIEKANYTVSIIKQLKEHLEFDSVTYRYVMPNTCYNWHNDIGEICLHIPLITNPGCHFVYNHRSFSMPADGSVYIVNNGKMHTFINAGSVPRLHLTFEKL